MYLLTLEFLMEKVSRDYQHLAREHLLTLQFNSERLCLGRVPATTERHPALAHSSLHWMKHSLSRGSGYN